MQQCLGDSFQQHVLIVGLPILDAQFVCDGKQQAVRLQIRVMYIGSDEIFATQGFQQFSAQDSLADPHFAGYLDETLATTDGDQQHIQSVLIASPVHEKTGIRCNRERIFPEAEVL